LLFLLISFNWSPPTSPPGIHIQSIPSHVKGSYTSWWLAGCCLAANEIAPSRQGCSAMGSSLPWEPFHRPAATYGSASAVIVGITRQ
jgi:hypothetical protein